MKNVTLIKAVTASLTVAVLSGCATTTNFQPQFYPTCFKPIEEVLADRDYKKEAQQAAAGAIAGAIVGALIGYAANNKKGAAYGAAAGATVGAAAGFIKVRLEKQQSQAARLAELQVMLGEEAQNLDIDKASVLQTFRCYTGEMEVIADAVRTGRMAPEEAKARMIEIKTGLASANQFWKERSEQINSRAADYENYIKGEAARTNNADMIASLGQSLNMRNSIGTRLQSANGEVQSSYHDAVAKLDVMLQA